MKEIGNETTRLVRVLTLISILIVLSGMAAIASADDVPQAPIIFFGIVEIDGEQAELKTTIEAYIDGEPCGSVVTDTAGRYSGLDVTGHESDDGKTITFKVGDDTVGTAVWHASTTPKPQSLALTTVAALDSSPTDDGSNGGSVSGGDIPPATTPTGTDAQPASWENVTSAKSVTAAESTTSAVTSREKLAEKPAMNGVLIGFEAVFVIAGLLAVVYLIRRR